MIDVTLGREVRDALATGRPVVALESTVYSTLGLPEPSNVEALTRSQAAIRAAGAVPAVTAVLDGRLRAGLDDREMNRVLQGDRKTAERDLAVAVGTRLDVGVTTVSASVAIAALAGIDVFATGGIGGVHRGSELTGDVSADLDAIGRHRVVTVSAGAKSFLDLARTLEALETLGVPVIGWRTDEFPAFTARTSGLPVPHRIDDLDELAASVGAQHRLGRGLLVVTPVPDASALDQAQHDRALADALAAADSAGIRGAPVTPFVLDAIATATGGASVPANLALVENNASLAAMLAVRLRAGGLGST